MTRAGFDFCAAQRQEMFAAPVNRATQKRHGVVGVLVNPAMSMVDKILWLKAGKPCVRFFLRPDDWFFLIPIYLLEKNRLLF